jgi:hypothetical protein
MTDSEYLKLKDALGVDVTLGDWSRALPLLIWLLKLFLEWYQRQASQDERKPAG